MNETTSTTNQREAYRRVALYDLIYYERLNRPKAKPVRPARRLKPGKRQGVAE